MRRGPAFVQVLTPLSLSLLGGVCLLWLAAFALVWTSLNEFRAGRGFRSVLEAYGAGVPELASQRLPDVLAAKPARYPYPRLLDGLLKIRGGKPDEARQAFQGVLDEKGTMLPPRERALALNGVGVLDALAGKAARDKGGRDGAALLASAKDRFQQAEQAWPELPESPFNLAMLAWVEGNPEGCRKHLARAQDPSRPPPGPDLARNLALARMLLAEQRGAYDEAVAEARRFRAYAPSGDLERILVGRALSRKLRAGPIPAAPVEGPVECEGYAEGPHFRDGDRSEILLNAAVWRMEAYWTFRLQHPEGAAKFDQARSEIRNALERASALAPAGREAARVRAVSRCRDLAWRQPPVPSDEITRGALPELAALAAQEGLDERTRALAENNLGWVLAMLGRGEEAIPHLERAAGLDPSGPVAPRNLAVVLDLKGDAAAARAWYRKSLAAKADQPDLAARLAVLEPKP